MVADGYTWTLRPTFAPKQRSRNRLQAKQGRGLNRNSGSASVHHTPCDLARCVFLRSAILLNVQHTSIQRSNIEHQSRLIVSGQMLRRRAPIRKPHASVRRFVARKILLRPECVHVLPLLRDRRRSFSTSCLRPAAISSEVVPIRTAALASKPSGRLHSGVISTGFAMRPRFEHGHW